MINVYEGNIPKLSKVNSLTCDGLIFWIKKEGLLFVAYEYKTKVNVAFTFEKEKLKNFLIDNIEEVKHRIEKYNNGDYNE